MRFQAYSLSLAIVAASVSACSSSGSTPIAPVEPGVTPPPPAATPTATPASRPSATPARTASPTPTPSPTGTMSASAVATALANVNSYFQTLPGEDPVADVKSLAAHMVSSGAFKTATVEPGGISATLSDGSPAFVFADHPEELVKSARLRRSPDAIVVVPPVQTQIGAATKHEIAFLVNQSDTQAFVPARQRFIGQAMDNLNFAANGIQVDVVDVSLANLTSLGASHPLDVLDIATHGAVASIATGPQFYINVSTTPVNDATKKLYASDFAAGRIFYSVVLGGGRAVLPTFAFTPAFVTAHAAFNPGAIVDNQSCFGQSPLIAAGVQTAYAAAGAGHYLGWTKSVAGDDADSADAFLFDRMLGEQDPSLTHLSRVVYPKNHAQRPFPLHYVEEAMAEENRSSYFGDQGVPYAISPDDDQSSNVGYPPVADGADARLIFSDLGAAFTDPPIENGLPSIRYVDADEGTPQAYLVLHGTFPHAVTMVSIVNGAGTYVAPVIKRKTDEIIVKIPNEGAGSSGLVTAYIGDPETGIASNSVPLTQWSGSATFSDNETITLLDGFSGSGNGSLAAKFAFHFRSDVAPAVDVVDASPLPSNLAFNNFEADSSGSITSVSGGFLPPRDGPLGTKAKGTFGAGRKAAFAVFATAADPSGFGSGAVPAASPSACNNAGPGPQPGINDVSCRGFGIDVYGAISCSDTVSGHLCRPPGGRFLFELGDRVHPGLLTLTLDPKTAAIVPHLPALAPFQGIGFYRSAGSDGISKATETLSISIGAPVSAPSPEPT